VLSVGGNNLEIACGPLDQRVIEKLHRQDVLIFTTAPLTEHMAITGGLLAEIFFSTNVVDTDITVKLIDVYPQSDSDPLLGGDSILVQDGIARAKWRNWRQNSSEALLSGSPSDTYSVEVGLWNTSYIFAAGHSIRVHVSSSNWPRFFPNPNTGNSFDATNVTASTTIWMDSARPSSISLPVVQLSQLPKFQVEEAVAKMLAKHEDKWRALQARGGKGTEAAPDLRAWLELRWAQVMKQHSRR
jgi:hypothetical protein